MSMFQCERVATPLVDPIDIDETEKLGLLVVIEGKKYNREDLYACDGCDEVYVNLSYLDYYGHCPDCARAATVAEAEAKSLRRWHNSRLL